MVNDYEDDGLARLPLEVWVKVFSYLSGPDLFRCEAVCADWRQEILHQVQCGGCRYGLLCSPGRSSSTRTRTPRRASCTAVEMPMMPPPITTADTGLLGLRQPSNHAVACV